MLFLLRPNQGMKWKRDDGLLAWLTPHEPRTRTNTNHANVRPRELKIDNFNETPSFHSAQFSLTGPHPRPGKKLFRLRN